MGACSKHLNSLDRSDPDVVEIESYIVAGMVILIVSEYEVEIERMFSDRADRCGDGHVAQFVRRTIARTFRSPDLGKLIDTLTRFGDDYKSTFVDAIINTEFHAAWDNVMKARHAVVHKNGNLNITFDELLATYPRTKAVLEKLGECLGYVRPATIP